MTSIAPTVKKIIKRHLKTHKELPDSHYIVKKLEEDHPELVDKYIQSHRTTLLLGSVTRALAGERNSLRKSQLAERLVSGKADSVFDLEQFWSTAYFVPGSGWKGLGELTGKDHEAIADKYEVASVAMKARADLHRNLAKKVGGSTTKETFKPTQLIQEIQTAYDTEHQLGA